MQLIKTALSIVDEARILDNSSKDNSFQQIIVMKSGNYETKTGPFPEWAKDLLPTWEKLNKEHADGQAADVRVHGGCVAVNRGAAYVKHRD